MEDPFREFCAVFTGSLQDWPPARATESEHPPRFNRVKGVLLEKFLMTRFKMIVLAAGLLAPLPLIAALPAASQTPSPAMAGPEHGAGQHHDGRFLSFLTPEQRAAFRIEARQEAREHMRAFRKERFQKLAAMTDGDRQKLKADMQARWDALPSDRKARIQERMARHRDAR